MEFRYKLIAVAVVALLSGTAFAAPMLVMPLDVKPYPHLEEGPKADFSIELIYANFSVSEWGKNESVLINPPNQTEGILSNTNIIRTDNYANVTYCVVANITNLSDIAAKMSETSFTAAQRINVLDSALGGVSLNRGLADWRGSDFGGVVDGIWLDGKWLNTTWLMGTNYPLNMLRVMDRNHRTLPVIPDLPENTSEGTWIEGVPIAEYYDSTHQVATQIYINGAWVDVTGRVQPHNPQPAVVATNTLVNLVLTSGTPFYQNSGLNSSAINGPVTGFSSWGLGIGQTYRWTGTYGFDKTWQPHESRLIIFNGTQTFYSQQGGIDLIVKSMDNGTIDLYGSFTSYLNNMPINGTYTNTISVASWLRTIPLQKTDNGYNYNTILGPNETFEVAPNRVEVYTKQVSMP